MGHDMGDTFTKGGPVYQRNGRQQDFALAFSLDGVWWRATWRGVRGKQS